MGTLLEHQAEIIAGEDLITRMKTALASSKIRTAGNIRDLNFGIKRGNAEIIAANKSIELHQQGFNDEQIAFFEKEMRTLRQWTGLLLGTCSGCTAGKINLAFDVTNMYRTSYNGLVEMGFNLQVESQILTPEQVQSINSLGLQEFQKIKIEPETISDPVENVLDPVPVPETNIVPIEAGIINDQDVNFENSFIPTQLGKAEEIGLDDIPFNEISLAVEREQEEKKTDFKNLILPVAALFIASGG